MRQHIIADLWSVTTATLVLSLSCMFVSSYSVKADQKTALPSSDKPWSASESDLIGDWQTGGGEGWRITLFPNHVVAVYLEGVIESKPAFSTWKMTKEHLIINNAFAFHLSNDKEYRAHSSDLMVLRVKDHVVLLPKENLAMVQRYGLASFWCFWRLTQKGLDSLPKGNENDNRIFKQIQQDQKKH